MEVHKQCFNLNNLHACVALDSAFQCVPVYKLLSEDLLDLKKVRL